MPTGHAVADTLKALVHLHKEADAPATRWRTDEIQPRYSPYPKTRRPPANGSWRSLIASAGNDQFMVFAQVQEHRENFKAWLALRHGEEWRILVRLEYHGDHPGLHVHDWCGVKAPPIGGKSIDAPHRRPATGARHRQCEVPTKTSFWMLALNTFRVIPYGTEQEDLL